MPRTRPTACLVALLLALSPAAAFGQGAGDDQYQDPFGEEPTAQAQQDSGQDDGLSDEPPGGGTDGEGESNGDTGGGAPTTPTTPTTPSTPGEDEISVGLPNTGASPGPLALLGVAFILLGVGLRLRTIDPDAY